MRIKNNAKCLRLRVLQKTVPECRRTIRSFRGMGDFVELWHFDKHFVKNIRRTTQLDNYILNGKFNPEVDTIRAFFQNQSIFCLFSKKGKGRLVPSPFLVARL